MKKKHSIDIKKQRKFTNNYDYLTPAAIRLHNQHIADLGGRNSWVKITNESNRKEIFRIIKGSGRKNFAKDLIECDYDTALELGLQEENVNLKITKASIFEKILAHLHHPDKFYRFPIYISMISLFLGIVGLALGILSLL